MTIQESLGRTIAFHHQQLRAAFLLVFDNDPSKKLNGFLDPYLTPTSLYVHIKEGWSIYQALLQRLHPGEIEYVADGVNLSEDHDQTVDA